MNNKKLIGLVGGVLIVLLIYFVLAVEFDGISYYPLDETAGTNVQDILGGIDGRVVNGDGDEWVTGLIGNAIEFDFTIESDEYVDFGNDTQFSSIRSISLWFFNKDSSGGVGGKQLVGRESDTNMTLVYIDNTQDIIYIDKTSSTVLTSGSAITRNVWHHVALIFNGTNTTLYIDGEQDVSGTSSTDQQFNTTNNLTIGGFSGGRTIKGILDEVGFWDRTLNSSDVSDLYNAGAGLGFPEIMVTLNSPSNGFQSIDTSFTFNATLKPNVDDLVNGTIFIWYENGTIFNETTNNSLSGTDPTELLFTISNFTIDNYVWNMRGCQGNAIGQNCSFSPNNHTFLVSSFIENQTNFNSNSFETASETFSVNITTNGTAPTNGVFGYNGIGTTATIINTANNNYNLSSTIDVPIDIITGSFNFNFSIGGDEHNTSLQTQTISPIILTFCNSTINIPYINFTFKNETTAKETLSASIDSTFNFWLGSGTQTKNINLVNSTEKLNHSICFSPSNQTLNTNVSLTYNNGESQQRSFTSEPILTNTTLVQVLYLLPSSLGLFGQFQTRDVANNPISLVKAMITRVLGGSTITVASGFTDSSGLVIFFLNPDATYTATFSKSGFLDNVFTFVPTTDIRFVTMGGSVSVNGSNISIGLNYDIIPSNFSLNNNTLVDFGFNVTGNDAVTFISMNLTNSSGFSWAFQSNAGTGFISQTLNTSDNKTIVGRFEIRTAEENMTIVKVWVIGNEFEGDYSIFKQGKLFLDYGFADFIRLLLVVLTLFGIVIFMSKNEISDNNESKIAVVILLIWIFSLIGWLDNPAIISETGIAQFGKQYGIAILSTVAGVFFFVRRTFV